MTERNTILREKAELLPNTPGVYLWLDDRGKVLYVGKAKNLRNRVLSYLREDGDGRAQVPWLMHSATDLDFIATDTEIEALVTEANLARARKPRYNIRLKDNKRYPYIRITKERFPRIYLTRTIRDDGSRYIGPYTDVRAVRKTLKLVHSIFPIRLCRHSLPSKQITRACLNHQINRCSGPCVGYIGEREYNRLIEEAYRFLQGQNTRLTGELRRRMRDASESLNFELAAQIRDRLRALEKVIERRRAFSTLRLTGDWDAVNFHVINTEACVVVMEIREGNILGKKSHILGNVQYSPPSAILAAFLTQYYLHTTWLPPEIHLPLEPEDAGNIGELLGERRGGTVSFVYPQRGEKARLLAMTARNAELVMKETIGKRDRARDTVPSVVLALKHDLRLEKPPRSIACIDISHLHGTDTVASLVFFSDGKPVKKEYRHFRIRTVAGIDDFASMREVVERYFSRRKDENRSMPDLLLVDGGKGQLSSAVSVLERLGLADQPVAGLAKRLEEVFLPGASEAQNIPKTSSSLHLLQRVRNEAHRFAVEFQKKLREKRTISSTLTDIEGIGPARAGALLKRFGSLAGVRRAGMAELAETPGIGEKRAAVVHTALHEKSGGPSRR
ncbi:MAG: excinuclease ABC subunit C [Candidatus Latescibacteria bacterium]|nr:excinuclease ABC subunit C [Candidatus Latescibacterota bacterium]